MENRFERKVAAALLVGSLAFSGCNDSRQLTPSLEPIRAFPTAQPETSTLLSNEQAVGQEALRMGLDSNENERMLWQRFGYKFDPLFPEKFSTPEAITNEANKRINGVLTLMYNSENNVLKKASLDFASLRAQGRANFYLLPSKEHFEKQTSSMETSVQLVNDKITGYIHLSAWDTLNAKSDIVLAIELAHEIEHVRNIVRIADSLDASLTPQAKLDKLIEKRNNRQEFLAEEARGYAVQAEAYIIAYGQGYRGAVNTSHERLAAAFIKSRKNRENSQWISFVEYYIKLVSQQP